MQNHFWNSNVKYSQVIIRNNKNLDETYDFHTISGTDPKSHYDKKSELPWIVE